MYLVVLNEEEEFIYSAVCTNNKLVIFCFFCRGFSVVAPELAVPGKTTAVLVTLHGPKSFQPLNVTLKLYPDPADGPNREPVETTQEIRGKFTRLIKATFFRRNL